MMPNFVYACLTADNGISSSSIFIARFGYRGSAGNTLSEMALSITVEESRNWVWICPIARIKAGVFALRLASNGTSN